MKTLDTKETAEDAARRFAKKCIALEAKLARVERLVGDDAFISDMASFGVAGVWNLRKAIADALKGEGDE